MATKLIAIIASKINTQSSLVYPNFALTQISSSKIYPEAHKKQPFG